MTARTRYRKSEAVFASQVGWINVLPGLTTSGTVSVGNDRQRVFEERMADETSAPPYRDQPMTHFKFRSKPPLVSGSCRYQSNNQGVTTYTHSQTAAWDFSSTVGSTGHLSTGLSSSETDFVNQALVKNNPGVAKIDLAAFIYELRELPRLYDVFISNPRVNEMPIAYLFGIRPLINDIQSAISLAESIDQRLRQIEKLKQGPVKERISLAERTVTASRSQGAGPYHGFPLFLDIKTTRRAWAVKTSTIETNPHVPPELPNTKEMLRLLLTNQSLVTLWEVMPWSWLIDYFVGVQEYLMAFSGNRIPGYKVLSLCVCIETKTRGETHTTSRSERWTGGRLTHGWFERLDQTRRIFENPKPIVPGFSAALTAGQITNLGALALAFSGDRKSASTYAKRFR